MRLLIAGGGTGGHIYPALAVARSLRERPDPRSAPELVWLGGHRGLEADLVREAGIRVRRLALRSLRTVDRSVHTILDPLRLGVSVPQAAAILARERPAAILTTGGYVGSRSSCGRAMRSRDGRSGRSPAWPMHSRSPTRRPAGHSPAPVSRPT